MSDRLVKLLQLHQADPADAFCAYGVALEYAKAGNVATALTWLDKVLALDADYFYAYFQKGKLLAAAGDPAGGRAALTAGLARANQSQHPEAAHAASEIAALLEGL